jgi:hypothetical protein
VSSSLPTFALVGGGHDDEVGQRAGVAQVEAAGVGGAVGADQAGAVDGEGDVEVLQADVVHELVVGALQEGGVDGHDGLEPFAGHAGAEGDGVLFGDADVEVALGEALGVGDHAGAFAHRRRDGHEPLVAGGGVAEPVAEDLGVARAAACFLWMAPVPRSKGVTPWYLVGASSAGA